MVPLTIPITVLTLSPANERRSGPTTGMAAATAASKNRSAPEESAASESSMACAATSALFAVTTDFPALSALRTTVRG